MPDWPSIWAVLRELFLVLGGTAFVWRVADLYRSRIRLDIADVTYDEHDDGGPCLHMEVDNNGRQAILLNRRAVLDGLFLGSFSDKGSWIRPRVSVSMRLVQDDRSLAPMSSRLLQWSLDQEELPKAGLYFVFWFRIRLQVSGRRKSACVRFAEVKGGRIGALRYWWGYMWFRYRGKHLRPRVKPDDEVS